MRNSAFVLLILSLAASRSPAQPQEEDEIEEAPPRAEARAPRDAFSKDLPPEARKIAEGFDRDAQEVRKAAEDKIDALRAKAIRALKPLQDKYTQETKLDEALAIRDQIRRIQGLRPDPGVLKARADDVGKTWYFEIVGGTKGSVWGSNPYTTDSRLSAAAVHAGVLKPGEKGIVKVTILPGQSTYTASSRFGVATQAWGSWDQSFTVEKYKP